MEERSKKRRGRGRKRTWGVGRRRRDVAGSGAAEEPEGEAQT